MTLTTSRPPIHPSAKADPALRALGVPRTSARLARAPHPEIEIVWLYRLEGRLTRRCETFMSRDAALLAAARS